MNRILPWIIWGLGTLFFFAEYFVRVSTGVMSPLLMEELHVKAAAVGTLSAFFYYSYIGMQIPVGVLVDKLGAKFLLVITTFIFGIACILFSTISTIWTGCIYRFIMGFTGAFAFVGTLKLITVYFESRQFALLAGITQGFGMLGAVIGTAPISYLFHVYGWRNTIFFIAFIFIAISIALVLFVKEIHPQKHNSHIPTAKKSSLWQDIKSLIKVRGIFFNCLFIGLMYAPTTTFGEQWGALFMSTSLNISVTQGSLMIGFIFIGMAIGCPLIGFISDHLQSRVKVMRFCSLACFILIILIIYPNQLGFYPSNYTYYILMFLYGIFNSAIVPSYALSSELVSRKISGIALGLTNMASVIIGSLLIPLVGLIIDNIKPIHPHIAIINSHTFHIAFILLPLCFILCCGLTYFIKDAKTTAI